MFIALLTSLHTICCRDTVYMPFICPPTFFFTGFEDAMLLVSQLYAKVT